MKKFKVLSMGMILTILIFVLASCGVDTSIKVYVRDIIDVGDGAEDEIMAQAVIKIDGVSKEDFDKDKDFIMNILKKSFINPQNIRFGKGDFTDYMAVDVEIPIRKEGQKLSDNSLYTLFVSEIKDGVYDLRIALNRDLYKSVKKAVRDEYIYASMDSKDFSMSITISNDLRKDVTLGITSVYMNGVPYPFYTEYKLARRKDAKLYFSNVLKDGVFYYEKVSPLVVILGK